jgi:hypothetical protein
MPSKPQPKPKKSDHTKTTNEKPVSLQPMEFDDALRALLSIPPTKETGDEKPKHKD